MIFTTERQQADREIDKIKSFIKSTALNYAFAESPYSFSIKLKKSYIHDYSRGSIGAVSSSSTPTHFSPQHNSSGNNADSGVEQENVIIINDLKQNLEKATNHIKNLEESINTKDKLIKDLEAKTAEIDTLKSDVEAKANIILKLNSKIKTIEDEKAKLKSEVSIHFNQLKKKNKDYDSIKNKLDQEQKEKESLKSNFK